MYMNSRDEEVKLLKRLWAVQPVMLMPFPVRSFHISVKQTHSAENRAYRRKRRVDKIEVSDAAVLQSRSRRIIFGRRDINHGKKTL